MTLRAIGRYHARMLFALLALMYAIFSAGRLLAVRLPYRREQFTLGTAWCAGYGAFLLWWVIMQPLLGAGPWLTPVGFVLMVGLGAGAAFQQWHNWPREQHHNAHILLTLLIGAPALVMVGQTLPVGEGFWQQAAAAARLSQLGAWPMPAHLPAALLPPVPGLLPLLTPLAALGDIAQPPILHLLINLGCLLAASGVLLVALNWPVKWSNLPLVAAGGLAVVAVANPWLPLLGVADAGSLIPAALCLLVAVLPLVNPMPLAGGATAIGPALSLVSLTLLHPLGWLLSLWVVLVYKLRMLAEGVTSPDHARRHLVAISLLATLPTVAWACWQVALHPFGASVAPLLLSPTQFFAALMAQLPAADPSLTFVPTALQLSIVLAALCAGCGPVLYQNATTLRQFCTTYAPLCMPLIVLVPPAALVAVLDLSKATNILKIQQFVWLVPLAAAAGQAYRHSPLRERLFATPWTYGLAACILLFSFILLTSAPAQKTPSPWPLVAADLRPYPLVLSTGLPAASLYEVSYYSNTYSHVWPLPAARNTTALDLLRQHNLPLLTTAKALPNLGISAQAPAPLLLFQPTANGATLLNKWNIMP